MDFVDLQKSINRAIITCLEETSNGLDEQSRRLLPSERQKIFDAAQSLKKIWPL